MTSQRTHILGVLGTDSDQYITTDFVVWNTLIEFLQLPLASSTWMTNTEIQAEKHIIQVENHHSLCFHPPPFAESRQRQSWSPYKKDVLESVRLIAERAKPGEGVNIILVGHWHSRTRDEFILGDHDQPDRAFLSVRELEVILRGTKARVTLVPQTCYDDFWKSLYWTLLATDYR